MQRQSAAQDIAVFPAVDAVRYPAAFVQRRRRGGGGTVRGERRAGGGGFHQFADQSAGQCVHGAVRGDQCDGSPLFWRRAEKGAGGDGAYRHTHLHSQRRGLGLRGAGSVPARAADDGHPGGCDRPGGAVYPHLFCGNARYDALQFRQRRAAGGGRHPAAVIF